MADDTLGLLVKLILDKGGQQAVKKGMEETAASVDGVIKSVSELTAREKELKIAIEAQETKIKNAKTGIDAYTASLEKAKKKLEEYNKTGASGKIGFAQTNVDKNQAQLEKYKALFDAETKALEAMRAEVEETAKLKQEMKDLAKFTGMSEKELSKLSEEQARAAKTAMAAQGELDKFNKELQRTERRIGDLNQLAGSIGQVSQGLFLSGSAIVGSIYLSANEEAKRIKEAGGVMDETTQKWLTAQTRIQLSYQRIGKTALTAFLPVLEKAAALAEKGSKFVESHPDLVRAALNVGGVVATVGAIGMLASKGIRLYADIAMIGAQIKYAASTALFKASVDEFLAGVAGQKVASSTGAVGGIGGSLAKAGPAIGVLIAGAFIIELERRGLNKILGTDQSFGDVARTAYKGAALPGMFIAEKLHEAGLISDEAAAKIARFTSGTDEFIGKIFNADDALDELTDGLDDLAAAAAAADEEGMGIIRNLEKDNLAAEKEYSEQRASIMARSSAALQSNISQLMQAESRIKGNLSSSLSKLGANFTAANKQADAQYQTERANIARDGNQAILDIERNAKEELRKLEEDFAVQKDELTRSRDALGLVKAQREFDRQKEEIENGKNKEIAERRRQTQQQLADLRQSYMAERAERLAKYKQDVADAKAQAAQELKEAQEASIARMAEISRQRAMELSELSKSYNDERRQRIVAAYAQIQDLGVAQNAERVMKARYHAIILQEATAFMNQLSNAYRPRSGSGGSTGTAPSRAAGGYVNGGLYNLHPNEFVLSPSTTAAAESLIGSQLSQQSLLMAMSGGGRTSLTLNDARRFDSSIPLAERRAIGEEGAAMAVATFADLLKRK